MFSSMRKWLAGLTVWLVLLAPALLPSLADATASVRQEEASAWTAATATTVTSPAFVSNCLTGSTIEVWVIWGGTTVPSSVQDSAGQTYTFRTSVNDNNDTITIALYTFQNNASTAKLTVTATWSSAQGFNGIWTKEITGVTSTPYQTSGGQDQCPSGCTTTAGTGAGAISSGNVTPTAQPALVSSVTWDDGGNAVSTVAGSQTAGINGWLLTGNTTYSGSSGSVRVTSTSATAATYTNATDGGTRHLITIASVYTEASTGSVPSRAFFMGN